MSRPKGLPKTGGRKKGSKTVVVAMREAVWDAFLKLGSTEALVKWARENQTEFYRLAAKLIPPAEPARPPDVSVTVNLSDARREILGRLVPELATGSADGEAEKPTVQ